jgi:integrase
MAQHLTDAIVKQLPIPAKGNKVYYDSDVAGLGARITANGARAFILNYRVRGTGRERRYTIGGFPDWRTTAARARARALKRDIDDGGDPLADIEAEREAPTVADLVERFEQEHLPRKRASTSAEYRRMIRNHIFPALGHLKVVDVRFEDIDALHRRITRAGHLHRANRVIAVASKMFSLATRWNMRETNPCRGIERNTEHHRRRYLTGGELERLVAALVKHEDKQAAHIIRLLLLTGCRRGEALGMRWADVDIGKGVWSKPASSTKQNEPHEVPLSAPARTLLNDIRAAAGKRPLGEYVFAGSGESGHRASIKRD